LTYKFCRVSLPGNELFHLAGTEESSITLIPCPKLFRKLSASRLTLLFVLESLCKPLVPFFE
jgi:hypothetical protein